MDAHATRIRPRRCCGTVEDHQKVALDVRELARKGIFAHPTGSTFRLGLRYPWLRTVLVEWASLSLELATGRTETVPLAWARCGIAGNRMRFLCPHCRRQVCVLYHLDRQVLCRTCGRLWYAAQRVSSSGRKALAIEKVRRKLGDYGHIPLSEVPPKPPGMWSKTYARHLSSLARIERRLYLPR
jgi:ribosomal protein S27E